MLSMHVSGSRLSWQEGTAKIQSAADADLPDGAWTEHHDKELAFQNRKRRHRECESFNFGHIPGADASLVQDAAAQQANDSKRARLAFNQAEKKTTQLVVRPFRLRDHHGNRFHCMAGADRPRLHGALVNAGLRECANLRLSPFPKLVVTDDVVSLPRDLDCIVRLSGGIVLTPEVGLLCMQPFVQLLSVSPSPPILGLRLKHNVPLVS